MHYDNSRVVPVRKNSTRVRIFLAKGVLFCLPFDLPGIETGPSKHSVSLSYVDFHFSSSCVWISDFAQEKEREKDLNYLLMFS